MWWIKHHIDVQCGNAIQVAKMAWFICVYITYSHNIDAYHVNRIIQHIAKHFTPSPKHQNKTRSTAQKSKRAKLNEWNTTEKTSIISLCGLKRIGADACFLRAGSEIKINNWFCLHRFHLIPCSLPEIDLFSIDHLYTISIREHFQQIWISLSHHTHNKVSYGGCGSYTLYMVLIWIYMWWSENGVGESVR